MTPVTRARRRQGGATLIEFTLGLVIFLTFVLGVIDASRMLWTWGAANEATRWGARTAVVCPRNSPAVLGRMRQFLPQLQASQLQVDWYGKTGLEPGCGPDTCTAVNVRIVELDYEWVSPIGWSAGRFVPMPQFSTFLPRESMGQDPDSAGVCA